MNFQVALFNFDKYDTHSNQPFYSSVKNDKSIADKKLNIHIGFVTIVTKNEIDYKHIMI